MEIYPAELILKRENTLNTSASFLDIQINIENNKFKFKHYDKRNDFPFSIVRMPFLNSNMPSKIFYASLGSEVLRLGRTTNDVHSLKSNIDTLLKRMRNQGAKQINTEKVIKKVYGKNPDIFKSFSDTSQNCVNMFKF